MEPTPFLNESIVAIPRKFAEFRNNDPVKKPTVDVRTIRRHDTSQPTTSPQRHRKLFVSLETEDEESSSSGDESNFVLSRKLLRRRHVRKEQLRQRKVNPNTSKRETRQSRKRKAEQTSIGSMSETEHESTCDVFMFCDGDDDLPIKKPAINMAAPTLPFSPVRSRPRTFGQS